MLAAFTGWWRCTQRVKWLLTLTPVVLASSDGCFAWQSVVNVLYCTMYWFCLHRGSVQSLGVDVAGFESFIIVQLNYILITFMWLPVLQLMTILSVCLSVCFSLCVCCSLCFAVCLSLSCLLSVCLSALTLFFFCFLFTTTSAVQCSVLFNTLTPFFCVKLSNEML